MRVATQMHHARQGVITDQMRRVAAREGLAPGGSQKNLAYVEPTCRWGKGIDATERLILSDAQTSGGLLIAIPEASADELLVQLERRGAPARAVVGEVVAGEPGHIEIVAA